MRPLGNSSAFRKLAAGAAFTLEDGWECQVLVLDHELARVLFLRDGAPREPKSWMVAPCGEDVPWTGRDRLDLSPFAPPAFELVDVAGAVVIATATLAVRVQFAPFSLAWSFHGSQFAADRPTQPYLWDRRSGALRHAMQRRSDEQYFGLGDKTGPLDHHGRRLRTVALDALGYDAETSDPLYKHWPFLIVRNPDSGIAFGQFYDTLAATTFDLGCEHDNYHGFFRYAEIDDGDLDFYVFPGPQVRDVVRRFTELTGRMAFGPRWSLGYANTAMALADAPDAQARLAAFADRAREHDVPVSAFHFGSGYTSIGRRRYVFTWNRDKFPAPREAIARFARQGIRTVVNLKPCLLDDHPNYAEVAAQGAFVNHAQTATPCIGQFWDGVGAHVDFTHPAGVDWWQRGLARQVLDYGIDAGWNDNNEYEIWDDDAQSHGFGTPLPLARTRPLHALLMTRATLEAQARHRPGERPFTVTRAGPPGIQRYAQTWSGDNRTSWKTLRWNIRMGLTMSLSGMFNTGHDIGGFAGPVPDAELLVRWVQCGAFSPRFIMNSWKDGGEVNTPWLHPEVLPQVRDAIRLRYRLLPYLYSLYRAAAVRGEPMIRPTFFDFEHDPRTFADTDDFMFGPSLLVAPVVVPGARVRRAYLPLGPATWHDLWTGRRHRSGRPVEVAAPLELIPLFVPAGAMIPTTATTDYRALHDEPSRQLRIFPAPGPLRSTFTLYEDDGLTLDHVRGDFAEIEFTLESTRRTIDVHARCTGAYALPYASIAVVVPADERRTLRLAGTGVRLVREAACAPTT